MTEPQKHYLSDYKPANFLIESTQLTFELDADKTRVKSTLVMRRNTQYSSIAPLELDGEDLILISIKVDQQELTAAEYQLTTEKLIIAKVPESFTLQIETEIDPANNTMLSGLFVSNNIFCTQCEAHGFRRMTYFLDRPDVLSVYRTTIIADENKLPILLSNGNLVEKGTLPNQKHFATWQDPFPKPCYLFALVAGDLAVYHDSFKTQSARNISLNIYVEKGNEDKCEHAMRSLKKAMRWDEQAYGREYDLDIFNIVAVSDFNMGAMENKGLNVFNAKYILVKPETATDIDYAGVESVVAHEYFHNWTGNRVTCRDWFQLSLKEGLTVFRDQEFSRDMNSRDVFRIEDVQQLRTHQFPEDAGPMAHPVMPDSYIEIDNFYTATVYNKGAEVIRMMQTLLGADGFRRGTDLYFTRHDGQAVTIEEFIRAMEDANKRDLQQFRRWYIQAGTPKLTVTTQYNEQAQSYQIDVTQTCPATPEQPHKEPFHLPLKIALLGEEGAIVQPETVLEIKQSTQQFTFKQIKTKPIPSLLRDFSAPVILDYDYTDDELMFLLTHDNNGFVQWEAGQQLLKRALDKMIAAYNNKQTVVLPQTITAVYESLLKNDNLDISLKAELLKIPAEYELASRYASIDIDGLHVARKILIETLAKNLRSHWLDTYKLFAAKTASGSSADIFAGRKIKNTCLIYLTALAEENIFNIAFEQLNTAQNMTDEITALHCLAEQSNMHRASALEQFYKKWSGDDLVIDKWFSVQARATDKDALIHVKTLIQHPKFTLRNPNKVRALIGVFVSENLINFHAKSGVGYEFLLEQIMQLDKTNPQIAARLMTAFTRWQKYDPERQKLMHEKLMYLSKQKELSKDVYEVVMKSL